METKEYLLLHSSILSWFFGIILFGIYLCPSTFWMLFWFPICLALSTTDETLFIEMRILCTKFGIIDHYVTSSLGEARNDILKENKWLLFSSAGPKDPLS